MTNETKFQGETQSPTPHLITPNHTFSYGPPKNPQTRQETPLPHQKTASHTSVANNSSQRHSEPKTVHCQVPTPNTLSKARANRVARAHRVTFCRSTLWSSTSLSAKKKENKGQRSKHKEFRNAKYGSEESASGRF